MSTQENATIPNIKKIGVKSMKKKNPANRRQSYAVPKVKQNIKRMVRTNERFAGNIPSLSDAALVTLANMALELGYKVITTGTEAANKLGKKTVGSNEIMAGVTLELKGELMQHCVRFMKEELAKSSVKK